MPNAPSGSGVRPALQHSVDLRQYSIASLVSLPACAKQLVVVCMNMPDVGAHGERNHLGIEPLRIGGSTDTSRVLEAGMLRDRHRLGLGTAGIEAADVRRKLATILDIDFGVPYCAAFAQDMQSGRSFSRRRQRPFPSSSPHSAHAESRRISNTTMSSDFASVDSGVITNGSYDGAGG
jgi:hypothetical protein